MAETARLTEAPRAAPRTFLDLPFAGDLDRLEADVAVLGIPHGLPYWTEDLGNDQSRAPDALRAAGQLTEMTLTHWDFDIGGPLVEGPGRPLRMVDCGNVVFDRTDPRRHYADAERAVAKILAAGAMPVILGGDHGVPIPALRALEGRGPVTLVQIDAHIDWRDAVMGEREGYSSPIRRASEMPWIETIVQVGIRGTGSARGDEVEAARAYGARIVTAWEVHDTGVGAALAHVPEGRPIYLTIDADGLDPTIMPGVMAPRPGGLTFHEARALIHGLAAKGPLIGMDMVEIAPSRDLGGTTMLHAERLIANAIGAAARSGRFG